MSKQHSVASLSADCLPARKASPAVYSPGPERYPLPAPGEAPPPWKSKGYKAQKSREWRARNVEKSRHLSLEGYKKRRATPLGWAAHALTVARRRAIKRGLASDITAAELDLPNNCPVFGVALIYGAKKNDWCSASLDRINPQLGYVKGNVRIISRRANTLRNNCTDPDIFLALAADAERLRG